MKPTLCLLFLSLAFTLLSCKKEEPAEKVSTPYEDPAKAFLKHVATDSEAEYFISGEFDGQKLYFASTFSNNYPSHDISYNAMYLNSSLKLDNIHLLRQNSDRSVLMAIYITDAKLFSRNMPYELPHANRDTCEAAQISLLNMQGMGNIVQGSAADNFTFLGHTNCCSRVAINSFKDNIVEGTFEGNLRTKTGSAIRVKNGAFRLKLVVVNQGK